MRDKSFLYVSTYEGSDGSGIYYAELDNDSGEVGTFVKVASLERAGLMAPHPQLSCLYAVGIAGEPSHNQGCINAYLINTDKGSLKQLNEQPTGAGLPTFITPSLDGQFLFQASFSSAAVSVLRIKKDGSLMLTSKMHRFEGTGTNPVRQIKSHPHCVIKHPKDDVVFISDLGTDQISAYKLNYESGDLVEIGASQTSIHLGAGPRIMRFSNDGNNLYIINELHNTISVYAYTASDKLLEPLQVISTLPEAANGSFENQMASEIRLHPNQKYVYVTNRSTGKGTIDGVAVFRRDEVSGKLSPLQHYPTGKHPRHFNIDPTGKWLFVSSRDSNQIDKFSIDQNTGLLHEVGQPVNFQQPWDIQFFII